MKIEQKLAKNANLIEKSPPSQIFSDFGLILGSLGDPKITKNQEKSKAKKQPNLRSQKNTKKSKKSSGAPGRDPSRTVGRTMEGKEDIAKTGKIWKMEDRHFEGKD